MVRGWNDSSPYRADIKLFLLFIPFISAINYYLTYSNIKFGWFLAMTFAIDTTQGYAAWWAVRSFIIYLDKRWSYEIGGAKRIALQLLATMLIGLFIIGSTTELLSWIVKGEAAPLDFYSIDLFIIAIWFFVINGVYIGMYYFYKWKQSEERLGQEGVGGMGLVVRHGKRELLLSYRKLAGLFVDGDYVTANELSGLRYYLNDSLDKMERKLPSHLFFRLNRQFLVHRQLVSGFKRAENGKILVMLNADRNFPPEVTVSRTKAMAFKEWFRSS